MHDAKHMTGFISGCKDELLFYNDSYEFHLLTAQLQKNWFLEEKYVAIENKNGFIFGVSHDNRKIAIKTNCAKREVSPYMSLNTDMYLCADHPDPNVDIEHFHRLVFLGGILNTLHTTNTVSTHVNQKDEITIKDNIETKKYKLTINQTCCELALGYCQRGAMSSNKYEHEQLAYLSLSFEEPQPISSISLHYQKIGQLIAFMTNRIENSFEQIYFSPGNDVPNPFLKYVYVHIAKNECNNAHCLHCISFEDLGSCIVELLQLIYKNKKNKPSISLGFIPRSDKEYKHITDDVIRAVCSAIECEALAEKIGESQSNAMKELCNSILGLVKEHERIHKDSPVLTEGTYSLIKTGIKHWAMSAYEKTLILYEKYKEEMEEYTKYRIHYFRPESFHELIKYRNCITHGTYQERTIEIEDAAICLEVLVYCCILSRIGVDKETRKRLCGYCIGY